jgi:hypothetical protein
MREGLDKWENIKTSRDFSLTGEQKHNLQAVDMAIVLQCAEGEGEGEGPVRRVGRLCEAYEDEVENFFSEVFKNFPRACQLGLINHSGVINFFLGGPLRTFCVFH